ncbi:MAG: UMP kinase, partial [Candidatus Cloacimonetes bacterium]|nr:UMP kinase [Candidatus Cloacimonadota bacterium]
KADLVLKGTKVDGVFTSDPLKDKNARFIEDISFDDVLKDRLTVMDMTAFSLARDNHMPIKVFNVSKKGSFKKAIRSKEVGTFIHD